MIRRTYQTRGNYSVFATKVLLAAKDSGFIEDWSCSADDYRARRVELEFIDARQEVLFKLAHGGSC